MRRTLHWLTTAVAVLATTCATHRACHAQEREFGDATPYYEDDAWYDVSEWFDGNDYNPTDEAVGRLDDEEYDFAEPPEEETGTSDENDYSWYGYDADDENDWYYDYADYGYPYYSSWYDPEVVEEELVWYSRYYDTDNDGLYDAYASYSDVDGDGEYEDVDFYTFSDTGSQAQRAASSRDRPQAEAKDQQLSGTVQNTKTVQTRGGKRLVVQLKTSGGQTAVVDLGRAKSLQTQPEKGSQLQASGKMIKVGDKQVLLATRANFGGQDHNISRQGQEYTGTVTSTRRAKVRGQEHLIAELKTQQGRKFLADLGPASDVASKVSDGAKLTVTGVPVELKDRRVLVARAIEKDGQRTVVRQGLPTANNSR